MKRNSLTTKRTSVESSDKMLSGDKLRMTRLNIASKLFAAKAAMQSKLDSKAKQTGDVMAKESLTLADSLIRMEQTMYGEEET